MKTTKITIMILALGLFIVMSVFGGPANVSIDMPDESYIDDIPFDTEAIYEAVTGLPASAVIIAFQLEDEAYIDDIPFNTEEVVAEYLINQPVLNAWAEEFVLSEESYINDIPFNTNKIFNQYIKNQ